MSKPRDRRRRNFGHIAAVGKKASCGNGRARKGTATADARSSADAGHCGQVYDFRRHQAPCEQAYHLVKPVFLVGFMGAGKTSVARKLARLAGVASLDMDTYIERWCGAKVRDVFAQSGEEGFRALEAEALRDLATGEPRLISCGGGVVLSRQNRAVLDAHGYVVYLKVTAAEAASRISNFSSRPLFGDLEKAQRVIEERLPLYEEVADVVIDTAGRGSGSVAREALDILKEQGVLVKGGAYGD